MFQSAGVRGVSGSANPQVLLFARERVVDRGCNRANSRHTYTYLPLARNSDVVGAEAVDAVDRQQQQLCDALRAQAVPVRRPRLARAPVVVNLVDVPARHMRIF